MEAVTLALNLEVLHLHTYFLFPITIDQDAVMDEHPEIWRGAQPWFDAARYMGYRACGA